MILSLASFLSFHSDLSLFLFNLLVFHSSCLRFSRLWVFFFHSPKEWHLNEKREGERIVLSFVLPIFSLSLSFSFLSLSSFSLQMHELNSILFVSNVENDNQMSFSSLFLLFFLLLFLLFLSLPTFHRKKLERKKQKR